MECKPCDSKKLLKVFETSKRCKKNAVDISNTDTDESRSGIVAQKNSKTPMVPLEKKHSSGSSSGVANRTSLPPAHQISHASRRTVKKKGPMSLALKPAYVSTPLSDSPEVTPRSVVEPEAATTSQHVDRGNNIYEILEELKKKKRKHHRRHDTKSPRPAAEAGDHRRHRSRKHDPTTTSSNQLLETLVKMFSQVQDVSKTNETQDRSPEKKRSNQSFRGQSKEDYSDIDRKPSKLGDDCPPRDYRNKMRSREDLSESPSVNNLESTQKRQQRSPRYPEPQHLREKNPRNSKQSKARHSDEKAKELYERSLDKCHSNERFGPDCRREKTNHDRYVNNDRSTDYERARPSNEKAKELYERSLDKCHSNERFSPDCRREKTSHDRYVNNDRSTDYDRERHSDEKAREHYERSLDKCLSNERFGPDSRRNKANDRYINNDRYTDYDDRICDDRCSDRVLDERSKYDKNRQRERARWGSEVGHYRERDTNRRYEEDRDRYDRDDPPRCNGRREACCKCGDARRYDDRNYRDAFDSARTFDIDSGDGGNLDCRYEVTANVRNDSALHQQNRAKAEKELARDPSILREVTEQRDALEKMMRLWQEVMRRFKDMTDNVGRSERVVQDTAVAAREAATTQMQLWRECMQRYDSVARDVGDTDTRLMDELQKQKSEISKMSSMWQECMGIYREISSHLTSLKQQMSEPAPPPAPPVSVPRPSPALVHEGDSSPPLHVSSMPPPGYPMMYDCSPVRTRASAPAAMQPPPWWWRRGAERSPPPRRQSSADSSDCSRRRRRHRHREREREKHRSKDRSVSKVDARSERRKKK